MTKKGQQALMPEPKTPAKRKKSPKTNPPVAVGSQIVKKAPVVKAVPSGGVIVSNTEYVCDVSAGTNTILQYDVNPINGGCFPWLARVAQNYEQFRFRKLTFQYIPMCSTSTSGIVTMAYDYNASDPAPLNKQQMSAYSGATRGSIWDKTSCSLSSSSTYYYVGNGSNQAINPVGTDLKLYDVAKFYFATFNTTQSAVVGELVVSYEVEFIKPSLEAPLVLGENITFSGTSLASPLAGPVVNGNMNLNITSGANSGQIKCGASGQFLCIVEGQATLTANVPPMQLQQLDPAGGSSYNVTVLNWTGTYQSSPSVTGFSVTFPVSVNVGSLLTFVAASAATALTVYRVRFAQYAIAQG